MIRNVIIFKSTEPKFSLKIEFWENGKLVDLFEIPRINKDIKQRIEYFIKY